MEEFRCPFAHSFYEYCRIFCSVYISSYFCPLAIVSLTLGISYATGNDSAYIHGGGVEGDLCWLQEQTYIWAFVAPASCIIAMNTFIMIKCLIVTRRSSRGKRDSSGGSNGLLEEVMGFLKSWITLTFLLGKNQ